MSIGAINNDRSTWSAANFSTQAAAFGSQGGQANFEADLKNSMGFGTRGDSGGAMSSIAIGSSTNSDLLSQLQFSYLKGNNEQGGLTGRLNNALF
jgi:hypothetical protein